MFKAVRILTELRKVAGETSETYSYQSARIKNKSLMRGISLYNTAIHKFMGNSIIKRLEGMKFASNAEIRARLVPDTSIGSGEWVDISGLIAPKSEIDKLLAGIEDGTVGKLKEINAMFEEMHRNYYVYEWTWVYGKIKEFYGIEPGQITAQDIIGIVEKWQEAVVGLDRMVYDDARKEFSMSSKTGFGADGSISEKDMDFEQVRGDFENNIFVKTILRHIEEKTALGEELKCRMRNVVL